MAQTARKSKKTAIKVRDATKEGLFKQLSEELKAAGYEVRRERLKTGFGFKVVSGSCRLQQNRLIFVDSKLNQDEQIEFLRSKVQDLERTPK